MTYVPIADGTFSGRSGRSWSRAYSDERNRADDQKSEANGGTHNPLALLTPERLRQFIDSQECPWCGAGPFKVLAAHTSRVHAIAADELRSRAGLPRSAKVTDPSHSKRLSALHGPHLAEVSAEGRAAALKKNPDYHLRAIEARNERASAARKKLSPEVMSLFEGGHSMGEIADAVGASISRVKAILRENGIDGDLRGRGAQLRGSPRAAHQWSRDSWEAVRVRLVEGGRRAHEKRKAELIEMYDEFGHTPSGIDALAGEIGVTVKSLVARLRKYGCDVPDLRGRTAAAQAVHQRRRGRPSCSVAGCGEPNVARRMCESHYRKWKRSER